MAVDFEDWTAGISVVSGPLGADLPDWTEAIAVGSGGAFYASLTGAGETASPGALTQAGGLVVNAGTDPITLNSASTTPMTLNDTGGGGIILESLSSSGGIAITSHATINITQTTLSAAIGIELDTTATSAEILIQAGSGGVALTASGANVSIQGNTLRVGGTTVGFYGHSPAGQGTVTGSRGGNAALASLLTQLAATGIIVDSSTA